MGCRPPGWRNGGLKWATSPPVVPVGSKDLSLAKGADASLRRRGRRRPWPAGTRTPYPSSQPALPARTEDDPPALTAAAATTLSPARGPAPPSTPPFPASAAACSRRSAECAPAPASRRWPQPAWGLAPRPAGRCTLSSQPSRTPFAGKPAPGLLKKLSPGEAHRQHRPGPIPVRDRATAVRPLLRPNACWGDTGSRGRPPLYGAGPCPEACGPHLPVAKADAGAGPLSRTLLHPRWGEPSPSDSPGVGRNQSYARARAYWAP